MNKKTVRIQLLLELVLGVHLVLFPRANGIMDNATVSRERPMVFVVAKNWDGSASADDPVTVELIGDEGDGAVTIQIRAPFYDDPRPPNGEPGKAFFRLWDYEVVEAFFVGEADRYLELEFGPHGQHLALLLDGKGNSIQHSLDLEYEATIDQDGKTWSGKARIPLDYFPPKVAKFNAYSIHNGGKEVATPDQRVYKALHPVPGPHPDFHRLEFFRPLSSFPLLNNRTELSATWKQALKAPAGKTPTI